jgi:hypothetical protein
VESPYYSESELCEEAVTVCFSKYLPWQAMHFLQRSTHFSKTCYRPSIASKVHAVELFFMVEKAKKSHGARSKLNSMFGLGKMDRWTPLEHPAYSPDLAPMRFLGFFNHENGTPRQEIAK